MADGVNLSVGILEGENSQFEVTGLTRESSVLYLFKQT